jgi:uncharacterized protein YfkK (UPF0435 family)
MTTIARVEFSFDYYEDAEIIKMHQKTREMFSALFDIYEMIRSERKYGESEIPDHVDELLDKILEECRIIDDMH